MTMMSAAVGRRSRRDSEADVETQIYVRPQGMAWDRVMVLQIMRGLETRLPRVVPPPRVNQSRIVTLPRMSPSRVVMTNRTVSRVTPVPPPGEPNVFLTPWTPADPMPPWAPVQAAPVQAAPVQAAPVQAAAVEETLVLEGPPAKARKVHHAKVPWLLFVMAFGIAFGIGQDRQLRRELGSKVRVTTAQAAAVVARRVSTAF